MKKRMKSNRRKRFIIDKQLQHSFIFTNLIILSVTVLLIFLAIIVWNKYRFNQGFLLQPPSNEEVVAWAEEHDVEVDSAEFWQQFLMQAKVYTFFDLIWKPIVIIFVINTVILILGNIVYSHRIAGPIYRLKKLLHQKLEGKSIEPIAFRKNDAFHDLADLMNRVLMLERKDKT